MNEQNDKESKEHGEGTPFFPLHMMKEIMVTLGVLTLLVVLTTIHPAGIEEAADPFKTPEHIKPEWYFLSLYQALKYVPQGNVFKGFTFLNLAITLQGVGMAALLALPFVDKYPHKKAVKRPLFLLIGLGAILFVVVFTYLGIFSGGTDPIFGMHIH